MATRNEPSVIPALLFVIPAQAGIHLLPVPSNANILL